MVDVVSTRAAYAISHSHAMRSLSVDRQMLSDMRCSEFLQLLLARREMGPTEAARAIELPSAQGTISKFLRGDVQDPRGQWTKLLPKKLGFDAAALRDEDVAEREAAKLGLKGVGEAPAPIPITRKPKQAQIDPGMLALQIADLMRGFSPCQRKTASALFAGAAETPDEAPQIAAALRALLSKRDGTNG